MTLNVGDDDLCALDMLGRVVGQDLEVVLPSLACLRLLLLGGLGSRVSLHRSFAMRTKFEKKKVSGGRFLETGNEVISSYVRDQLCRRTLEQDLRFDGILLVQ